MSLIVVGSVALDTIETPGGRAAEALGGSAVHFALAASLLTEVRLEGFVGTDFPEEHVRMLADHGIDLSGLISKPGKTFRWTGRYSEDMNFRETLSVDLNVFGEYEPDVPAAHRAEDFLFLANGSPAHQVHVLDQMESAPFAILDTMDHWIASNRPELDAAFKRVNAVVVNDSEAALLTDTEGLPAADRIREMGPEYVIVKKGAHGACMICEEGVFLIPAYPVDKVVDPTGAGDTFAGGMMGYLAECGTVTADNMRRAIAYGTITASFNVEDFGVRRTAALTRDEVEDRLHRFQEMLRF